MAGKITLVNKFHSFFWGMGEVQFHFVFFQMISLEHTLALAEQEKLNLKDKITQIKQNNQALLFAQEKSTYELRNKIERLNAKMIRFQEDSKKSKFFGAVVFMVKY